MTPDREALVKRIQKLLGLAMRNPNPHEAEAAMAKVIDDQARSSMWTPEEPEDAWSMRIAAALLEYLEGK